MRTLAQIQLQENCDYDEAVAIQEQEERKAELPSSTGSGAEVQKALLIAGQLAGLSFNFDADALERWLNTKPKDFNYETWCRAAIAFKRAIALPPNG